MLGDVQANLPVIDNAANKARLSGVEVLVFPECFLTGDYNRQDRTRDVALTEWRQLAASES